MWERTLKDLIRGLRANRDDEAKFIAVAIDEIRSELKTKDMELKAAAILKLVYLEMLGYDMSWASFNVVEVMSSSRHHLKAVGYLAAIQSFNQDTDVLMLTTNLVKKDLTSNPADITVTLNGVAHIVTPDLGRDIGHEISNMLTHSRPSIRKRAILAMHNVMAKHPDIIETALPRLKDRLQDSDPGVVAATVNVICELARKDPTDFLPLAPQLFHLLTSSSNNWMLIKLVKLFGSLCPHEARLVKKLFGPISELISNTPAISLLYECVHTAIIGGMLQGSSGYQLARACTDKLAGFIQDSDQNLKYIALLAMVKIVPTHPHLIAEHQDVIMSSINDEDLSIRMRALDLITSMVTSQNIKSVVQQLLSHLVEMPSSRITTAVESLLQTQKRSSPGALPTQHSATYRLLLVRRILEICSADTYSIISDFDWYLSVLVDLSYVANVDVGAEIRDQLVDIVVRVRAARRFAVTLMVRLLADGNLLASADSANNSCAEVLWAAAWITGEYCSELSEPQKLLDYLLNPLVNNLSPETIAVYIHAVAKICGFWMAELGSNWDDGHIAAVRKVVTDVVTGITPYLTTTDIEVQERAAEINQLFTFIQRDLESFQPRAEGWNNPETAGFASTEPNFPKSLFLLRPLFSAYPLNPVAPNAQESVPIPEGLDLDQWIVPELEHFGEPEPAVDSEVQSIKSKKSKGKDVNGGKSKSSKRRTKLVETDAALEPAEAAPVETEEERLEREQRKAERLERLKYDPYYIQDNKPKVTVEEDVDSIPVIQLDLPSLSEMSSAPPKVSLLRQPLEPVVQEFVVDREGEMPRSAKPSQPSTPSTLDQEPVTSGQGPEAVKVVRKKKGTGTGKKKKEKTLTSES